jgi:hypothetical protein
VPKQLEEVAFLPSSCTLDSSQFHWHARVYGDEWHVAAASIRDVEIDLAEEQAIMQAQELYNFSQHDSDADDDDDDDVNVATDDDEVILPRADEDTIILIVQDRLGFDDRDLLIETLDSLCKRVNHHHNDNFAENRKAAVLHGAPLAIIHAMRQKEDSVAIQIIACLRDWRSS